MGRVPPARNRGRRAVARTSRASVMAWVARLSRATRHHRVAGPQARNTFAHRGHPSGTLATQGAHPPVVTGADAEHGERVHEVEAGGHDLDLDLAGTRWRGASTVEGETFDRAGLAHDGAEGRSPAGARTASAAEIGGASGAPACAHEAGT